MKSGLDAMPLFLLDDLLIIMSKPDSINLVNGGGGADYFMHPDPLVQRPIGTFIALAYSGWNCGHFYNIWMFLVLLLLLLWEMLSNYLSMFQTPRYVPKNKAD